MKIGLPKEIKDQEFRVGLTPASVQSLCRQGHEVFIETGAGQGAGFIDEEYHAVGGKNCDGRGGRLVARDGR
jgi:alanine dehydrogenase